ncbi:MAG: hypothetical protein ACRELX_00785, partial [Longimicrobiales bacterium]
MRDPVEVGLGNIDRFAASRCSSYIRTYSTPVLASDQVRGDVGCGHGPGWSVETPDLCQLPVIIQHLNIERRSVAGEDPVMRQRYLRSRRERYVQPAHVRADLLEVSGPTGNLRERVDRSNRRIRHEETVELDRMRRLADGTPCLHQLVDPVPQRP